MEAGEEVEPQPVAEGNAPATTRLRELEAEWAADYVYGVIATLVAIGGENLAHDPHPVNAAGAIVVGVGAIWLAHAFSGLAGDWVRGRVFTPHTVLSRLRKSWPVLSAAIPATFMVSLSAAGAYSSDTALLLAEYVGIAALAVIGIWAAVISTRTMVYRVLFPVTLVAMGWLIVGLEQLARQL